MSDPFYNLVWDLVDRHCQQGEGRRLAIMDDGAQWRYHELQAAILRIQSTLAAYNYPKGTRMAMISKDNGLSAAALLAIMRHGYVACPLNVEMDPSTLCERLSQLQARLLVADDTYIQQNDNQLSQLPIAVKRLARLNDQHAYSANIDPHWGSDQHEAFVLFTSGTTGHPQAVPHRHRDPRVMNQNYGQKVLKLSANDVTFSPSKLYFAYGLNSLLFALYHGGCARISSHLPTAEWMWHELAQSAITVFFGVPRAYRMLLNAQWQPDRISPRLSLSAGERLPQPLARQWYKLFGQPILDGIGTTEMLSTFISNSPDYQRTGSTGVLVPGFQARLVKADGQSAASGETGVLWLYGDTYAPYYVNDPQKTAASYHQGWFHTNDLFYQDHEGYFYYQGRQSDMIRWCGELISPYVIEDTVMTLDDVYDCALIAPPESSELSRPQLFVVSHKPQAALTCEAMLSQIAPSIELEPEDVHWVDSIPTTPAGKKQRHRLQQACVATHAAT